jgi:sialate O-acetylesterase
LVGEVWLASGQSNMAFPLSAAHNADTEVPRANDASLRLFVVEHQTAASPQSDLRGRWQVCSPATARGFSAVAYFFGRDLRTTLGRPVGLINSSWGGTPAQTWLSIDALRPDPPLAKHLASWEKAVAAHRLLQADPTPVANYQGDLKRWQSEVAPKFAAATRAYNEARANGDTTSTAPKPERPEPANPDPMAIPSPSARPQTPSVIFNAMIAPLIPFPMRGVIWYQGEANVGQAKDYEVLFPRLILDWRTRWAQKDFPFLFVQLPAWARPGNPLELPALRDVQRLTFERVPHTAMAVTLDLGNPAEVHPTGKLDVGLRLSRLARARVYGESLVASGPTFREVRFEGAITRVRFQTSDSGLVLGQSPWRAKGVEPYPTDRLVGFELRGSDGPWFEATARISGDEVIVSHPDVSAPAAVRYAWTGAPRANLYNREGLPAAPFNTETTADEAR